VSTRFLVSFFKQVLVFLFLVLSQSRFQLAEPPLSPPFHPHSLVSDCRSVQFGCSRFIRCCYLIIDLCSPFRGTGPGPSRSHLISAVKLGCLDQSPFFLLCSLFLSSYLSQFFAVKFRARIA
jgi:hypothetical protein